MRVGIYKTDDAPDLTLLLREGSPPPMSVPKGKWRQVKVVTDGEVRADLLTEVKTSGYFIVRKSGPRSPKTQIGIYQSARLFAAAVQASLRHRFSK